MENDGVDMADGGTGPEGPVPTFALVSVLLLMTLVTLACGSVVTLAAVGLIRRVAEWALG